MGLCIASRQSPGERSLLDNGVGVGECKSGLGHFHSLIRQRLQSQLQLLWGLLPLVSPMHVASCCWCCWVTSAA